MTLVCPCPKCGEPVTDWQPWKVAGGLSISFVCRCGASWQVNGCSIVMPPVGAPPDHIPQPPD